MQLFSLILNMVKDDMKLINISYGIWGILVGSNLGNGRTQEMLEYHDVALLVTVRLELGTPVGQMSCLTARTPEWRIQLENGYAHFIML